MPTEEAPIRPIRPEVTQPEIDAEWKVRDPLGESDHLKPVVEDPITDPGGKLEVIVGTPEDPTIRIRVKPARKRRWPEDNRRRRDTKPQEAAMYRAMLYTVNGLYGTYSEMQDFWEAVVDNITIQWDGGTYSLSELDAVDQAIALFKMASGQINFQVNWEGMAKDLWANYAMDKAVGKTMQKYGQALQEMNLISGFR